MATKIGGPGVHGIRFVIQTTFGFSAPGWGAAPAAC